MNGFRGPRQICRGRGCLWARRGSGRGSEVNESTQEVDETMRYDRFLDFGVDRVGAIMV